MAWLMFCSRMKCWQDKRGDELGFVFIVGEKEEEKVNDLVLLETIAGGCRRGGGEKDFIVGANC